MVKITGVADGSRAARAGIAPGDLLVSVNGKEIRDVLDYRFYLADETVTLSLLDGEMDCTVLSAVDKVVGKAAAFLYILLGIRRVYALTISESALALLQEYGVAVGYDVCVPRIKNREGTGFCPMESAVLAAKDPSSALRAIRATLTALRGGQK